MRLLHALLNPSQHRGGTNSTLRDYRFQKFNQIDRDIPAPLRIDFWMRRAIQLLIGLVRACYCPRPGNPNMDHAARIINFRMTGLC